MKLLALVLLLSAFSSLTLTEVVNSFKRSCPDFFIPNPNKKDDRIIPTVFTGNQYKKICQRWNNTYRFATVYDTVRRIPVYSAYTLLHNPPTQPENDWKIEPQLENIPEYKGMKEMIRSPREAGDIKHQAVIVDNLVYDRREYDRGHLFPNNYAADLEQAESTYTLTNIAPQIHASNQEWADQVETPMRTAITQTCNLDQNHLAYIVTGVVPGNNWISIIRHGNNITNGINIPSHYWSAFCCTSINNVNQLVARAYIANQEPFNLQQPSIKGLNNQLTELYKEELDNKTFNVFPGLY